MTTTIPDKIWNAKKYPNRAIGYINGNRNNNDNDVSFKLPGGGNYKIIIFHYQ